MSIIILEFENLYLFLYLMAEIATHTYTKWQKSKPIPIPELKNCDPSERTRHFLGLNPPGVSPILMVHHFLRTNPYKMSIFEMSVTCSFFRNWTHILTRNRGEKFENMFLVKITSKGTSLALGPYPKIKSTPRG